MPAVTSKYAELEIGLHRVQTNDYQIELRFIDPQNEAEMAPAHGIAAIDYVQLRKLELEPDRYGKALAESLFEDEVISTLFGQAKAKVEAARLQLRVRLLIGPSAPELHAIRWELLVDPDTGRPLATSERILLSRYLASRDWRPVQLRRRSELRVLIAVSAPSDLEDWNLARTDPAAEIARVRSGLVRLGAERIDLAGKDEPLTLSGLISKLRLDEFDVLYLSAHGSLHPRRGPYLILQDATGKAVFTPGSDFATRISELVHLPRLVILASCESARVDQDVAALAPLLAEAGVPAILAMQGRVSVATLQRAMPVFFAELIEHGQIDRALAVARGSVRDSHDSWMLALFLRLKSGRIWYEPGFASGEKDFAKWKSICRRVRQGKFIPILGPDVGERVCGTTRELANRLARAGQFPLAPHDRSDLAKVTQYLSISQDREYARGAVLEQLRKQVLQRCPELGEGAEEQPLSKLLEAVEEVRQQRLRGPYQILADLPGSIYVTASAETLLFKALRSVGKAPELLACKWRPTPDSHPQKPSYEGDPSPEAPIIHHVFGYFGEPESLVLTEDDFFDYLIATAFYKLFPPVVSGSLMKSSLIFLGFQLTDWTFRVLFRLIMTLEGCSKLKEYSHVAVQVDPQEHSLLEIERAKRYLEDYFRTDRSAGHGLGEPRIDVYWGSATDFLDELQAQLKTTEDQPLPIAAEEDRGGWD